MTRKIYQGFSTRSLFFNLIIWPKGKNSPSSSKVETIADISYQTSCGLFEFRIHTILVGILYHCLVFDVKLLNGGITGHPRIDLSPVL